MADQTDLEADLLFSYLTGNLSDQERDAVSNWVGNDKHRSLWLERKQELWNTIPAEQVPSFDLIAFKSKLDDARRDDHAEVSSRKSVQKPARWLTFTSISGMLALLVISWLAASKHTTDGLSDLTSTYTTANGERATVALPDGSTVTLNVGSSISVPASFASANREVRLVGEALFSVSHSQSKPFTVHAGNSTTKVLGTSFVVRKYQNDTTALVAVRDGRVMVGDKIVEANQQLVAHSDGSSVVTAANEAPFTFAQGIMTLQKTTLADAVPELMRWYDVDIRIGNPVLDNKNIAGEFVSGSVSELVQIFEWTFNIKVVKNGRILTLFPQ